MDDAEIKYSTVQNWYPGDKDGVGGIYNFVTKRGACRGRETLKFLGHRWKLVQQPGSTRAVYYKEIILLEKFYSIAITNNYQKADTGTKMIHLAKIQKAKSSLKVYLPAKFSDNTYRGLVDIGKNALNSNYTQCDSLLMGNKCGAAGLNRRSSKFNSKWFCKRGVLQQLPMEFAVEAQN